MIKKKPFLYVYFGNVQRVAVLDLEIDGLFTVEEFNEAVAKLIQHNALAVSMVVKIDGVPADTQQFYEFSKNQRMCFMDIDATGYKNLETIEDWLEMKERTLKI
jgi:hypothetical protein